LDELAKFILVTEVNSNANLSGPQKEPSRSSSSRIHLYDRSIMLAYLTNHPILKDYQEQWPKERTLFINEKGEMAPLAKQIDEMLEAIAKAQS
jgi:hypothetical protein